MALFEAELYHKFSDLQLLEDPNSRISCSWVDEILGDFLGLALVQLFVFKVILIIFIIGLVLNFLCLG